MDLTDLSESPGINLVWDPAVWKTAQDENISTQAEDVRGRVPVVVKTCLPGAWSGLSAPEPEEIVEIVDSVKNEASFYIDKLRPLHGITVPIYGGLFTSKHWHQGPAYVMLLEPVGPPIAPDWEAIHSDDK
jgi:hypothetical protein